MMAFLSALAAFLKAVPIFDKWGDRILAYIAEYKEREAQKAIREAKEQKDKSNDSSKLEDFINGK